MVIDAFPFFNELDLLEVRLATLSKIVDKFVIVEATRTHQFNPKPLFFKENEHRFRGYRSKIHHVVVDTYPEDHGTWFIENHQRNEILRGLEELHLKDDDLVIISDADEIPNPKKFPFTSVFGNAVQVMCPRLYYYKFNCAYSRNEIDWESLAQFGPRVARYQTVKALTPQRIRTESGRLVFDAAWHFSFLGDERQVREKILAYAHNEFNRPDVFENLNARLNENIDVLGRGLRFHPVQIDESFPQYLQYPEIQERFSYLIA